MKRWQARHFATPAAWVMVELGDLFWSLAPGESRRTRALDLNTHLDLHIDYASGIMCLYVLRDGCTALQSPNVPIQRPDQLATWLIDNMEALP